MKYLKFIIDNGCIVFGIAVITFKILDWYNPFMNFLGSAEIIVYLLCAFSVISGFIHIFEKKQGGRYYVYENKN